MRATSLTRLVFSSTAAVYGEPEVIPIPESAPKIPVSPYGASKLAAERMISQFGDRSGIRSIRLRYFNACGADPDGEIGEDHAPETHLIPLVLDTALGRRSEISVFGTDYPTQDGTAVRDYIHVCDLAAAHLAAMEHLLDDGKSDALNLGTGRGISVGEIIEQARRATGLDVPWVARARRAGDPPILVADPSKARRLLGWQAQHADPATILRDAWNWHWRRFGAPVRPAIAAE
jgi:UDP-glucose 4-epimerase